MSKKQDDLEAIVDLLHEWCVEHGEDYASIYILNGAGGGNTCPTQPDYRKTHVFKDYAVPEDTTNEAQ